MRKSKGISRLVCGVLALLLVVASMPMISFNTYVGDGDDDVIIYGSGWEFFYEGTDQRNDGFF